MSKKDKAFGRLVGLMEILRSKKGCPWDKVQTHKSIKPYLVEETCEVLDAIDKRNPDKLKEELGDLLYQVVFHSQIARERKRFNINDVIENVYKKLKRRHPHVFGKKRIKGAHKVIENWYKQKYKERKGRISIVGDIPLVLPALQKAGKVQKRVSTVGFDWKHTREVLNKVDEEIREVKEAIKEGRASRIEEEIGDLLFSIANLARFLNIEPENALHQTINKFITRFKKVEKIFARQGKDIEECRLEEMEEVWNMVKKVPPKAAL